MSIYISMKPGDEPKIECRWFCVRIEKNTLGLKNVDFVFQVKQPTSSGSKEKKYTS